MKKTIVLPTLLVMLSVNPVVMALTLSDGQSHTISTYYHSDLKLDPDNDIIPGTHVNLIEGGEFFASISLYNHASVNIDGGTVKGSVSAKGDNTVTITDGLIRGWSTAKGNSTVNILGGHTKYFDLHSTSNIFMSGGSIGGFRCRANSIGTVSGGSIEGKLAVSENGIIYLHGTDFEVDGQPLSPGDRLSNFVPLTPAGETHYQKTGVITGKLADGTALNSTFNIWYFDGIVVPADIIIAPEPALEISIDIKPQSCPNPVNVKGKGILPVAILGSDVLNVNDIDYDTVLLEGIAPLRGSYEDVASPAADDTECACTTDGADGYMDLTLKFDTQGIFSALGEVVDDELWMLHLTGNLKDGTPIEGTDCIVIKNKGKK